jgi:hypothetical protein
MTVQTVGYEPHSPATQDQDFETEGSGPMYITHTIRHINVCNLRHESFPKVPRKAYNFIPSIKVVLL